MSASSTALNALPQRTVSKTNLRKKSLKHVVKQSVEQQASKSRRDETAEDTLEFTQFENVKNVNGLPRVIKHENYL